MNALRSTIAGFALSLKGMVQAPRSEKDSTERAAAPHPSKKITVRVVYLINRTTQVELKDGKRFFGEKVDRSVKGEIHATFVEFSENSITLDVPPRMCSNGHHLELELEFAAHAGLPADRKMIRFYAQGTVGQAEIFRHDHDNISLTFTQHDPAVWKAVLDLYQSQQLEVLALFRGLKGVTR